MRASDRSSKIERKVNVLNPRGFVEAADVYSNWIARHPSSYAVLFIPDLG